MMFQPRDIPARTSATIDASTGGSGQKARSDERLQTALAAASPRLSPRPTPTISVLIYAGVLALWVVLFARALSLDNAFAWSVGVIYILYDSALMALVGSLTWPLIRHIGSPIQAQASTARPTLGVIIAAHNEALVLPRTLMALCEQTDPPDQILVVDDGSTDDTEFAMQTHFGLVATRFGEISPASAAFPSIRWMRQAQSGKARALNAALEKIDSTVVLTIDADTLPAPDALAEVRKAFAAEQDLVAAGGILIPICDSTWLGRTLQWFQTYEYIRNVLARFAWARMKSLLLISGAFAAFRRDALMAVGGFDPACLVEDYELTHRLHRYSVDNHLGWQLRMVGTAHARTEAPSTVLAFLKQRRRWFAGFLQTQYWNRDLTGNRRYGRLGTLMLPIKALDTLQPIYGLAAFALLLLFLANGKFDIAGFIFSVIGLKLVTDFAFQIWTIDLYRKLTGDRSHNSLWKAIVAALFEPFSFQLLRHLGATWGWVSFLTGTQRWSGQTRTALGVEPHVHPSAGE